MREYFEERDDQRRGDLLPEVVAEGEVSQGFIWVLVILSALVVAGVTFVIPWK